MNAISLALEKDEEWNQIVEKTQKMTQTLSNIKSRLQSSLTYLLLMKEKKDAFAQTDINTSTSPLSPRKEKTKSPHLLNHQEKYHNYRNRQLQSKSKSPNKVEISKAKTPELNILSNVSAVYNSTSGQKNVSPFKYQNIAKQTEILSTKYTTISERFQIGKFLGRGKFSDVFQAQDKQSKVLVALKVIQKQIIKKYQMDKQLAHEIKIQSFLNHPNILKLFGVFQEPTKIILILEYAPDGELYKFLKKQPYKRFSEAQASQYILQIIEGIGYIHREKVIHRDLKPENILISNVTMFFYQPSTLVIAQNS